MTARKRGCGRIPDQVAVADTIRLFLERVAIRSSWGISDAPDLERKLQYLAVASKLTQRQQRLLFTLLRDAERGERADINENTRKAGLRRILRRTGHANFEELRRALKLLARGAVIAGLWLPHE